MSIFGTALVFDYKVDERIVHKVQVTIIFDANDIINNTDTSDAKRRAILVNCMSQDSYRLVRDLLT